MKKGKAIKISLVLVILILLAVVGVGYIYMFTDMFKSPKELFFKYLLDEEFINQFNTEEVADTKDTFTKYETEGSATFEFTGSSDEIAMMNAMLNDLKLNYTEKVNKDENKYLGRIALQFSNQDILSANLKQSGDIYGIMFEEIANNCYIAIENNNLKKFAQNLGIDESQIPDKIDFGSIISENKQMEEKLKTIYPKYLNAIPEQLPEERFSKQKDVSITISGNTLKTNSYTIVLNEKDIYNILLAELRMLKDDTEFLNLIVDNFNKLDLGSMYSIMQNNMNNSGISYSNDNITISVSELQYQLQELITDLESSISTVTENEVMKVVVYENNAKMVRAELIAENATLTIDNIAIENGMRTNINITITEDGTTMGMAILVEKMKNGDSTVNCTLDAGKEGKIELALDYDTTKNEKTIENSIKISLNYTPGTQNNDILMDMSNSKQMGITINIAETIKLLDTVSIEEPTNTTVILNTLNANEIVQVIELLQNQLTTQIENKVAKIFGMSGNFNNTTDTSVDGANTTTINTVLYDIKAEESKMAGSTLLRLRWRTKIII